MAPQLHMYPCFMWSLLPIGIARMCLPVFLFLLPVKCYTKWSKAVPIRLLATLYAILSATQLQAKDLALYGCPQVNISFK